MSELPSPRTGPIEGTSRVLRELLRTPNLKKTIKILLNELDPENAGLLVRTFFWEDPEFFISLLGATPSLVNAMAEGTREFSVQMNSFPPRLLAGFMRGIIDDIDAESIGEAAGTVLVLLSRTAGLQSDTRTRFWEGAGKGFSRSLGDGSETASIVEGLAGSIRTFAKDNPDFVRNVIVPLVQAGRDALAIAEESKDDS
jgi:hypothetical protein